MHLSTLRKPACDPESVVEYKRMVPGVVSRAPHLDDSELSLHPELALSREPELQDPVHEIMLLVLRVRGATWIGSAGPVRRRFSGGQRSGVEVPERADERGR